MCLNCIFSVLYLFNLLFTSLNVWIHSDFLWNFGYFCIIFTLFCVFLLFDFWTRRSARKISKTLELARLIETKYTYGYYNIRKLYMLLIQSWYTHMTIYIFVIFMYTQKEANNTHTNNKTRYKWGKNYNGMNEWTEKKTHFNDIYPYVYASTRLCAVHSVLDYSVDNGAISLAWIAIHMLLLLFTFIHLSSVLSCVQLKLC